jgi:hypothetical protein
LPAPRKPPMTVTGSRRGSADIADRCNAVASESSLS